MTGQSRPPSARDDPRPWRQTSLWLPGITAAVTVLLIMVPEIDLVVARWFHLSDPTDTMNNFLWRREPWAEAIHEGIQVAARGLGVVLVLGVLITLIRGGSLVGWSWRQWSFLALALALGPGLAVNGVLKEVSGRARPSQLEDFGQDRRFTRVLAPADQCGHNCSFPCGDASLAFYLHSFAYVLTRHRRRVFWGGIAAGFAVGWVRIGMGGHFLTDVWFSGLITVACSAAAFGVIFGLRALRMAWPTVTLSPMSLR